MIELLKKIQLFSVLSESELAEIQSRFSQKTCKKDDVIIYNNDITRELYFVVEGEVTGTLKIPGNMERRHGNYRIGDFFGDLSLFGNRPSFDTYYAAEAGRLLKIREEQIRAIIENNPGIGVKLIAQLLSQSIQRLRKSSRFLADVVQWGENASRRAITDDLTGVYNRAFLDDAMENFFNISCSNRKPLSLFMVDIDNFRAINETMGIETGNEIIKRVVEIIKNNISQHGIIARYGGDEFSILLPEADLNRAKEIAESMRCEVESQDFSGVLKGSEISVTVSIGISSYPETAGDFAAFKEKADSSLYQSKREGRNRVVGLP